MAAQRALGRAFLAAGGTMLALGGATAVVSGVSMALAKAVMDRQKSQHQIPCAVCRTKRRVVCEVCEGERIIKYWPTPEPPPAQAHTWSVCSMCEGAGDHPCINCVGTGSVYPQPWDLVDLPQQLQGQQLQEQELGSGGRRAGGQLAGPGHA